MPLITYNRDIPFEDDNPSVDQPDMKINTNSTDDIIAVDHYSFNDSKGGSHRQVTLTNEAAPGLGDGTGVLYANLFNGNSWPYWQNALGSFLMLSGDTLASPTGYTNISQGIMVQWGSTAGSFGGGTGAGTTNFPIAFRNNCFVVIPVPFYTTTVPSSSGTVNVNTTTLSTTSFQWRFNSNSGQYTGFYWLAIGN